MCCRPPRRGGGSSSSTGGGPKGWAAVAAIAPPKVVAAAAEATFKLVTVDQVDASLAALKKDKKKLMPHKNRQLLMEN